MDLRDIITRHNRYQDSMVEAFEAELRAIVLKAQARVIAQLQKQLSISDGVIDSTPANIRTLRKAAQMFMDEMNAAGYQQLVNAFVDEFDGTLPFLQDTIDQLGKSAGQNFGELDLSSKDLGLLDALKVNTAMSITDAMDSLAGAAVTRGLFGVAGLKFGALVESLTEKFEGSVGRARSLADTAMSNFYATASARQFEKIAGDLPEQEIRYRWSGPIDKLERPFCRHLSEEDGSYTREQIDKMNNHQFPVGTVFFTRGGWNCRHQWVLDVREFEGPAKVLQMPDRQAD